MPVGQLSRVWIVDFNALMPILKPHSNGPLYCNTAIGTLAVDGWAVAFGTARRGLGGQGPPSPLIAVPCVRLCLYHCSRNATCVAFCGKYKQANPAEIYTQPHMVVHTKRRASRTTFWFVDTQMDWHMLKTIKGKAKGKGLDTCYSATYMSQTRDQQRFTTSEVAADWHEPMSTTIVTTSEKIVGLSTKIQKW